MQVETDYSIAIKTRFPLPLTIAIAKTDAGWYNPITLGWWMSTSHVPPMFAISIVNPQTPRRFIRRRA